MAPAGGAKYVHKLAAGIGGGAHVVPHVFKFVQYGVARVVAFGGLGYAVYYLFAFGGKGAKQLVPYNEEHAHVTVNILLVLAVVYAVVAGGYKQVLKPAHFFYQFGMHKYAPYLGGAVNKHYVGGLKAGPGKGYKVYKAVQRLKHAAAKAGGKIKLRAAMVGNVYGPKKAHFMVYTVQPVIHKVFGQQQHGPV